MAAAGILEDQYGIGADVWSVTGYKQLYHDGLDVERWNTLHPEEAARVPYVSQCLEGAEGTFVMASDYVKAVPNSVARWLPKAPVVLGTDGYGRSESRPALRQHFEVSARTIAYAALSDLVRQGVVEAKVAVAARRDLGIEPDKVNPLLV